LAREQRLRAMALPSGSRFLMSHQRCEPIGSFLELARNSRRPRPCNRMPGTGHRADGTVVLPAAV